MSYIVNGYLIPHSFVVMGFGGTPAIAATEPTQHERFEPIQPAITSVQDNTFTITIPLDSAGNGSVTGGLRGVGSFGIIRSVSINQPGIKFEIYSDNDMSDKLQEFNG